MRYKIYLLFLIAVFVSCHRKVDNTPRLVGKEYYNNKGSWIVYKVDSIVFSDFGGGTVQKIDTFIYQVKEIISEKFTDNAGKETNRIERYKRAADSLPWQITNVWISNLGDNDLQKVEENNRYVKLVFPVYENKTWNGNQFNSFDALDYTYIGIKQPVVLNGYTFDNTITVLQNDSTDDNFIEKSYAKEIYAINIGMVYKQLYYRETAIDWSK